MAPVEGRIATAMASCLQGFLFGLLEGYYIHIYIYGSRLGCPLRANYMLLFLPGLPLLSKRVPQRVTIIKVPGRASISVRGLGFRDYPKGPK